MATNRDKFLELRKSGVDPITARKQSYWEIPAIANAPVAWVAPAITPIAPAPTTPIDNKQVLANNQAKVAWEIQAGTRPAVWQQSESLAPPTWTTTPSGATLNADWTVTNAPPVNATANPTTPAPTATPTTATASNTATWAVDFNVWAGREQDIVKNLQTFKTQGMDDNAIKNASGYATADATKKAQIDGFLAGQNKPLDKTTALSGMMAWTPPPVQNTPEYRAAQNTYANFQKFNGMTVPQLVDNLKQGEITTEMNNLLAQNPNYQLAKQQMQAYQNTQNINNAVNGFSSGINGKEIDTPDYLQALSDKILTKLGLSETSAQQAFKDIVTNDSKVVEYTNQLSAINRQVADTTKLLNDGYKDLKAQYGDMPSSALITLMNSRFSTANDTLANLNNSKSYLEADLKNAVEMARGEYEAAAQDIQNQNTIRNNLINQATQAQFGALQNRQNFADSVALKQMDYAESERIRGQEGTTWQSANITRYNPATGANDSTPIFYRKKTNWAWFEAVDLAWNPIDANLLAGWITWGTTGGWTPGGWYATGTSEMRTDRNNNPTAFTVDIAKQAWLVEWVDYVVGDKFPGSSNLYTAKIIWDPIETSIRVIDKIGFKTKSWQNRWTYTDKLWLTNESWANMSPTDKVTAIKKMYQQEGGNGKAIWEAQAQTTATPFNPLQVREFEAYDWKTIPAQYKTPMEQDQFVRDYNKWIANKPGIKIETWDDVLKIKLDKPTGEQSAALAYWARMVNASKAVTKFEDEFLKLPIEQQYYQSKVPDILASQNQKSLEREKQDFITAVLRKESGAAISPSEFAAQDRIFFPQPGDWPDVVIAKRNARNFRVKAMLWTAWYDAQGNTPATYFTPEVIVASEPPTSTAPTWETPEQRIARLRNQNK